MNDVAAHPVRLAPLPKHKSLRAKAFIATLALMAYLLGSGVYVSFERARIDASIQALQQLARHEKALALTEAAVNGAALDINEVSNAAAEPSMASEIALYMESCARLFAALDEFDPRYALLQRAIARSYQDLQTTPVRDNWIDLREAMARASGELEIRHRVLLERRDELTLAYQRHYDAVTVKSLLLSLVGLAVFGTLVVWFFARLTGDISRLESNARQIVQGGRGVVMPVERDDELGRLMHAVNQMSVDLYQREKRIELDAERRSHHDKMMTLGALAAGIAHEVNNPLAVIVGVAQDLGSLEGSVPAQRVADAAQRILAQTQRASQAARILAELAAPQPTEFDWVDINAMVRRVLQLMAYDKRYRHIGFDSELAADLPAVQAPGAVLQQVLMQMVTLGCDALNEQPRGAARVQVLTRQRGGLAEIDLVFPAQADLNRPATQRTLLLCRALIEPARGRLALDQGPGSLLRIQLTWPAEPGSA